MDPLSIISGTLAVVGAAVKASQWVEQGWDLRHREQDFQLLWNQLMSLRSVLWSMQIALKQVHRGRFDHGSGRDCLGNIEMACMQAVELFSSLNQELQEVKAVRNPGKSGITESPVKRSRWVRRKTRLTQLASQTTSIITSLIAALGLLRDVQASVAADEATARIEELLQQVLSDQTILVKNSSVVGSGSKRYEGQASPSKVQELALAIEHDSDQEELEGRDRQGVVEEFVSAPSSPIIYASPAEKDPATSEQLKHIPRLVRRHDSGVMDTCKSFCKCRCHATSRMQTPQWAAILFGHMAFYGNCSVFLNRRACNLRRCYRSGTTYMQLLYATPAWASAFFQVYIRGETLRGFGISMPRVISNGSEIWHVIKYGNVQELRRWLSQHLASPYDVNAYGQSLLMYAASSCQHEAYSCLLSEKADPYFRDSYGTMACQPALDRVLSASKPSAHDTIYRRAEYLDEQDFSLLHLNVLRLNSVDLVTAVDHGLVDVDVTDTNGRTPLWWAASTGHISALDTLLEYGADVNKADLAGYTPLTQASWDGQIGCAQRLLHFGASVTLVTKFGSSPLHFASKHGAIGTLIVQGLLDAGADVHARDAQQATPLHLAAKWGFQSTIKLLLGSGADVDPVDGHGYTPATSALAWFQHSNFMCLVEAGAQLSVHIIHHATWFGSPAVWDFLAQKASEGQLDATGLTALHDGHDIFQCFRVCRDLWYRRKREADEFSVFQRMISAIDSSRSLGRTPGKVEEDEIDEAEQA